MVIGILSMQRIMNYGSIFQAYSLKTIIEEQGHSVIFVDYRIKPDIYSRQNIAKRIKLYTKNILRKFK